MNVRMVMEVLAPGVQHRGDADLGAEVLGIGGDDAQRFGRRPEQDRVDHSLVLEGDLGNRPKCQGLARAEWLAERQAELLPVPYFHVVFSADCGRNYTRCGSGHSPGSVRHGRRGSRCGRPRSHS
jgi:hypothetical protein